MLRFFRRGKKLGFTILEVVIVLAVSGLLFTVLIASTSSTIQRHRYEDSTQEAVDMFQQFYADVANTQINTPDSNRCQGSATGGSSGPGRTSCVVYGKMIEFLNQYDATGNPTAVVRSTTVIGDDVIGSKSDPTNPANTSNNLSTASDESALKSARLRLATTDVADSIVWVNDIRLIRGSQEVFQLAWGASLRGSEIDVGPIRPSIPPIAASSSRYLGKPVATILILRAPISNTIKTFIVGDDASARRGWQYEQYPSCMVGGSGTTNAGCGSNNYQTNNSNQLFVCVSANSNGDNNVALNSPSKMRAIRFLPNGDGPSSVELLPMDVGSETQPDVILAGQVCH